MKLRTSSKVSFGGLAIVILLTLISCGNKNSTPQQDESSTTSSQIVTTTLMSYKDLKINDPEGKYTLFSDRSITKYPIGGRRIGNKQVVLFEYDESKGIGLKYTLFVIENNGDVRPIDSGDLTDNGDKTYSKVITISDTSAKEKPAILQISTVDFANIIGPNGSTNPEATVILGNYFVQIEGTP